MPGNRDPGRHHHPHRLGRRHLLDGANRKRATVCDPGRMTDEETPVGDRDEDGWDDVYGEAPPVDDRELSQHPGIVSGDS
ncbi:hypothetical protein GCM10009787_11210 [Streptomyces bangladeshensis]|uniref:Uncharacterized protein n=1 Tax=Streptomyces bangladeshensis TaxID=295352 RepID=A0ABP5N3Z1_9ACTN